MTAEGRSREEGEEVYLELGRMIATGRDGVLVTVLGTRASTPRHAGSKMIVHAEGHLTGSVGGGQAEAHIMAEAGHVLADRRCRRLVLDLAGGVGICGGEMEVFLEPVLRTYPLLIIGAGHLGRAIAEVGRTLPLALTVVDDRPEYLEALADLPGVAVRRATPAELSAQIEIPARGGVLVATRGHDLDRDYLETVLAAELRQEREFTFLGVLGSRAKVARLRQGLEPAERLDRAHMPVGIEIGAETPAEIALSILAEVLAVMRQVPPLPDEQGRPLGYRLKRARTG